MTIIKKFITFLTIAIISLSLFLLHLNNADSAVTLKGLVGHWSMDSTDVSGQTYYDKSGFKNIGAGPSTLKITAGKLKQARNFIGNPNAITIVSSPVPANGTISAWVRTRNTGSISIFGINGPTPELRMNDGLIYCYSHQTSTPAVSTRIVNDGKWHHVACTWRGTTSLKAYIDSILDGSATPTTTPSGTANMYIGNGGDLNNFWYVGDIDEVRLYNRDLSQAEISGIYNDTGSVLSYAPAAVNPIAWWTMDAKDILGQTIFDQTKNHNDLTSFPTSPTTTLGKFKEGISFDGSNGYASGTLSKLIPSFNNTSITFMAWVNSAFSKARSVMVDARTSGGNTQWSCRVDSGGVLTFLVKNNTDGSNTITSSGVGTNKWQHVACVWDINNPRNDIASIYLNGSIKATFSSSTFDPSGVSGRPRALGVAFNEGEIFTTQPDYFNGKMDDVRIYNQALTSSTILKIYNETQKSFISYPSGGQKGLVGYWNMDNADINGSTVYDKSGQKNNLSTVPQAATTTPGKIRQAMSFDGAQGYAIPATTVNPRNTSVTISAWVNPNADNDTTSSTIFNTDNNAAAFQFYLDFPTAGNPLTFFIRDSGGTQSVYAFSTSTAPLTRWTHVVGVWNLAEKSATVYINGRLEHKAANVSINTALIPAAAMEALGATYQSGTLFTARPQYFSGSMDEVRVYNYAMSQTEVSQLYNSARTLQIK